MFCTQCGHKLREEAKFCHSCGDAISNTILKKQDKAVKSNNSSSQYAVSEAEYTIKRKFNRKKGILWLTFPIFSLILIMVFYAITLAVFTSIASPSEGAETMMSIVRVLLSLLGVAGLLALLIGIPVGIAYLTIPLIPPNSSADPRSGKGDLSEIPQEIKRWNWGAAGLNIIWGIPNKVWHTFWMFVPILNLFYWVYLGVKGNQLAWKSQEWESPEVFLKYQRKWKIWGIIAFLFTLIVGLANGAIDSIQSEKWTGFYYPYGLPSDESTWMIEGDFNSYEECIDWIDEVSYGDEGFDYECGSNCKYETKYQSYVCEETLN
ncbi:zinc-ribbon domain-containing protein [Candidatus Nomurabacteria bacterium]|nr:zinc-ribbon domain-containing protein [Candidatus Nomurabacteria bacterium]